MTTRKQAWQIGKRIAPPRFVAFTILFLGGMAAIIPKLGAGRGSMAAFDIASAVFLLSIWPLLKKGKAAQIRAQASANDANRALLLAITGVTMVVILVAVANELKDKNNPMTAPLVIGTLALAWIFSNTIYALHYAHLYYQKGTGMKDARGLDIPECSEPNYWDFIYFSFTLGMTFQTSDVQITSHRLRRIALFQSLAAFVFNLGVIAFTINVLGGG
ncbi:DUF1345 domain-containing protein [soil metagenome]